MKRLFVCGDSWFSTDPNNRTQSFAGQLAAGYGMQLHSFARVGCSNFAIALQVDKAIEQARKFNLPSDAPAILIGPTTPDRIELPIIDDSIWAKTREFFNWRGWFDYQPGVYIKRRGIANVKYDRGDLGSQNDFLCDPTIISESLNNLAFDESGVDQVYALDTERKDALKSYMVNLYDTYVKRQYDSWIISDAVRRVQAAGIPYLVYTGALYDGDYIDDLSWVPKDNLILPTEFNYYRLPVSGTSMSHLDTAESKMMADYYAERLKQLGFINE